MRLLILALLGTIWGCSTIQKYSLRSTSGLFRDSNARMARERDWEFFRASAPGNLKFMELLSLQDKDNLVLLATLAKGYAGYAFSVHETLFLEDSILGLENSVNFKSAISLYTRSLDYGLVFLDKKGISKRDLLNLNDHELKIKLGKKLSDRDLEGVLYLAQSWGSLINLQKDNMSLVSQVPRVKILFDFVCKEDPKIDDGVCDLFFAQYEAARPKMLGGNPQLAKELYMDAMSRNPKNLLIRISYIQYLLLPAFESDLYEMESKILKQEFAEWDNLNRDSLEDHSSYRVNEDLNLYNAVAKKRFEIIEKNKAKIF